MEISSATDAAKRKKRRRRARTRLIHETMPSRILSTV